MWTPCEKHRHSNPDSGRESFVPAWLSFLPSSSQSRRIRTSTPQRCQGRKSLTTNRRSSAMTLRPQDSAWKEDRDRKAIESEFIARNTLVDSDMSVLRERMAVVVRKEKQWREICEQFAAFSFLTGIPMIDDSNGEPTPLAWIFLFLMVTLPVYVVYLLSEWLHHASLSFSQLF